MGTSVVNPSAESAAAEPNFDLSTFSPDQYKAWEEKGTIPDAPPAAPSTADQTEESQAGASSDDEPAAESAPASQEQPPKGKGADARKAQLAREIQESLDRRKTVQKEWDEFEAWKKGRTDGNQAAAPSTAAKPTEQELKRPTRPEFGEAGHEGETWAQFEARQEAHTEALADYKVKQALKETRESEQKQAEEARQKAEAEAIDKTFTERLESAKGKHADYAEVAFSADVPITRPMDAFIRSQEAGPEVLYYLGQHSDEAKAIAQMAPLDALFALSKIALSLEQPAQAAAAPTPKKDAPVVPITRAARPATELGATSAAPVNDLQAAVDADDLERFEQLRNRQDIERRKRG